MIDPVAGNLTERQPNGEKFHKFLILKRKQGTYVIIQCDSDDRRAMLQLNFLRQLSRNRSSWRLWIFCILRWEINHKDGDTTGVRAAPQTRHRGVCYNFKRRSRDSLSKNKIIDQLTIRNVGVSKSKTSHHAAHAIINWTSLDLTLHWTGLGL